MAVRLERIDPARDLRTKLHGLAANRHLAAGALQPEDNMYFVMSVGNEVSCDVEYRDVSKSTAIKLDGFHHCNFLDAICLQSGGFRSSRDLGSDLDSTPGRFHCQRLSCRRTPYCPTILRF